MHHPFCSEWRCVSGWSYSANSVAVRGSKLSSTGTTASIVRSHTELLTCPTPTHTTPTHASCRYAQHFAASENYRRINFQTCAEDRPLVVQFCVAPDDAGSFIRAAELAAPDCDAVDINLCWPQQKAAAGPYGAYLQENHWKEVIAMIAATKAKVDVPISCKMCLFPTTEETVAKAAALELAGCDMIVVHGRARAAGGKGAADWTAIKAVRAAVSVPVIANGGVASREDIDACLAYTGADAMMIGHAALADPTIFNTHVHADADADASDGAQSNSAEPELQLQSQPPQIVHLAREYLELAGQHPTPSAATVIRDHLAALWHRPLLRYPPVRDEAGQPPPPLATDNLPESTGGVLRPPSLFSRGGSLLPSVYADTHCRTVDVDAVIVAQKELFNADFC